ncbi:MAG: hypothetical protein KDD55_06365 [Bdellovibrionales bacterium]|nr:hypothetical protein [Bdellovibrionales bacterium]
MTDNVSVDVNDPDSWDVAKRYAGLLGPVPTSVSQSIKILWEDHLLSQKKGEVCISSRSFSAVKRIEKSSVLKMPLFFAAQALYRDRLHDITEDDMSRALVRVLHPGLFASLLGLIYMHRRYNKICAGETWDELSKEYILNMEVGFLIGKAAPSIGDAVGVLLGGVRAAALATLLKRDEQSLVGYRNLKKKKLDVAFEHERWGCDHGQIAAFLLRNLGLSFDFMQMAYAIRGYSVGDLPAELQPWRAAILLIDGVKEGVDLGEVSTSAAGLTLLPSEKSVMQKDVTNLFEKGSTFGWMFKGSKDT